MEDVAQGTGRRGEGTGDLHVTEQPKRRGRRRTYKQLAQVLLAPAPSNRMHHTTAALCVRIWKDVTRRYARFSFLFFFFPFLCAGKCASGQQQEMHRPIAKPRSVPWQHGAAKAAVLILKGQAPMNEEVCDDGNALKVRRQWKRIVRSS